MLSILTFVKTYVPSTYEMADVLTGIIKRHVDQGILSIKWIFDCIFLAIAVRAIDKPLLTACESAEENGTAFAPGVFNRLHG